jgi:hypothetical protein
MTSTSPTPDTDHALQAAYDELMDHRGRFTTERLQAAIRVYERARREALPAERLDRVRMAMHQTDCPHKACLSVRDIELLAQAALLAVDSGPQPVRGDAAAMELLHNNIDYALSMLGKWDGWSAAPVFEAREALDRAELALAALQQPEQPATPRTLVEQLVEALRALEACEWNQPADLQAVQKESRPVIDAAERWLKGE